MEVHLSEGALGRGAITKRADGLLCIYVHWKLSAEHHHAITGTAHPAPRWTEDEAPLEELYRDVSPEIGLYADVEDARREVLRILQNDSIDEA